MSERRGSLHLHLAASVSALVWLCYAVATALAQQPTTFTVVNTDDSGTGSLRQAIADANATPNVSGQADRIVFNIGGSGVLTIRPTTLLPSITEAVIIDGYTQPGASANTDSGGNNAVLRIQVDGSSAGASSEGIRIVSSGSTVRGLNITGWGSGILLAGSGNRVEGNFIGTNATGTSASANSRGVHNWP